MMDQKQKKSRWVSVPYPLDAFEIKLIRSAISQARMQRFVSYSDKLSLNSLLSLIEDGRDRVTHQLYICALLCLGGLIDDHSKDIGELELMSIYNFYNFLKQMTSYEEPKKR